MIPVSAKITGLTTKHSFGSGRVAYALDVVILGKRFSLPVDEEFVARLDQMLEPTASHDLEDETASEYVVGAVMNREDRDPNDYSVEEISQL
jgi:hypothetical protein